jgi:hypothetical protein
MSIYCHLGLRVSRKVQFQHLLSVRSLERCFTFTYNKHKKKQVQVQAAGFLYLLSMSCSALYTRLSMIFSRHLRVLKIVSFFLIMSHRPYHSSPRAPFPINILSSSSSSSSTSTKSDKNKKEKHKCLRVFRNPRWRWSPIAQIGSCCGRR